MLSGGKDGRLWFSIVSPIANNLICKAEALDFAKCTVAPGSVRNLVYIQAKFFWTPQ